MRGRDGRHDMHPCQISNYCSHVISGVSLRLCTYSYSGYFPHFVHDIASLADPCVSPFAEYKKVYSVSQKKSSLRFSEFFPKRLGIFSSFLHTYYTIISTLEYKFLFKYLKRWQSYAILNATT